MKEWIDCKGVGGVQRSELNVKEVNVMKKEKNKLDMQDFTEMEQELNMKLNMKSKSSWSKIF